MPYITTVKGDCMDDHGKIWLVGAGIMAQDYAKVLIAQKIDFSVIGRGDKSAEEFEKNTGIRVIRGGTEHFVSSKPVIPAFAIVSVSVEQLEAVTSVLASYGVKNILAEKPSGLSQKGVDHLRRLAKKKNLDMYVAYNRRFYASVLKAKEIIALDGGISSFAFEFTEWSHIIAPLSVDSTVKEAWALANSSHVIDLAFYLGGKPTRVSCYTTGSLSWHPKAAVFTGAGKTETGALFSYHANWESPGRWGVEILTRSHRLIFRPLEKLQIQNIGSVSTDFVEIDDLLDTDYKPGLFRQVDAFLKGETAHLKTIEEQSRDISLYSRIAGYR
jgi:predicted dehydrogenase